MISAEESRREHERLAEACRRFGLPEKAGRDAATLAGDAGARRYFRASTGSASVLLVLYPEPRSQAQESWTELRRALAGTGLRVPALLDDAPDLGIALEEDLGDTDLAREILAAPHEDRPALLEEAESLLLDLRSLPHAAAKRNPPFDAAFFARELDHTRLWALERGGERPLADERGALWASLATGLAEAAADPAGGDPVPTHRDYHANNLMRAPDGRLALIDFQDLRLGPPDYDPVSLRFERAGAEVSMPEAALSEAVLLQRAWKVLGTFEKMLLKGREIYRPHRDTALRVLRAHTRKGGRFEELLAFLP